MVQIYKLLGNTLRFSVEVPASELAAELRELANFGEKPELFVVVENGKSRIVPVAA